MTPSIRTRRRRLIAAVVAGVVLGLSAAAPASAHAVLRSTSVADGEVLQTAPSEVAFSFNEPVGVPRDGVRVFDGAGERVDAGDAGTAPGAPETARVGIDRDLENGTYIATYRVTSADGHPVRGAVVFSVGAEGSAADEVLGLLLSDRADRPFAVAMSLLRWLTYAAALAAAGGAVFLWWLRREVADDRLRLAARLRLGAWIGLVAAVLMVPLQNVLVTGRGLAGLVDGAGLAATLATPTAWSAIARLVGFVVLLAALRSSTVVAARVAVAAGGLAAAALLLEGHTLTTQPAWLVVAADAAHVAAGAVWFGGLLLLAPLLAWRRRADDPEGAGRLIARFSEVATVSLVALGAAGIALAWAEVRVLRALTSTPYGWTLVAKTALVLPVLALGWRNRQRLVPAIARARAATAHTVRGRPVPAGGSAGADGADRAWALLRRNVRAEIALLVAVLGVSAVLVALQPAAEAAGVTGVFSVYAPLEGAGAGLEGATVNLTVDPNRVGQNAIHTYLLDPTGRPADLATEVTYSLEQPELGIGPISREPSVAGPGHHQHIGTELNVPGRWVITVNATIDRFSRAEAEFEVVVNP